MHSFHATSLFEPEPSLLNGTPMAASALHVLILNGDTELHSPPVKRQVVWPTVIELAACTFAYGAGAPFVRESDVGHGEAASCLGFVDAFDPRLAHRRISRLLTNLKAFSLVDIRQICHCWYKSQPAA